MHLLHRMRGILASVCLALESTLGDLDSDGLAAALASPPLGSNEAVIRVFRDLR